MGLKGSISETVEKLGKKLSPYEAALIIGGAFFAFIANGLVIAGKFTHNNKELSKELSTVGGLAYILPNILWTLEAFSRYNKAKLELPSQLFGLIGFILLSAVSFIENQENEHERPLRVAGWFFALVSAVSFFASAVKEHESGGKIPSFAKGLGTVGAFIGFFSSVFARDNLLNDLLITSRLFMVLSDVAWIAEGFMQMISKPPTQLSNSSVTPNRETTLV